MGRTEVPAAMVERDDLRQSEPAEIGGLSQQPLDLDSDLPGQFGLASPGQAVCKQQAYSFRLEQARQSDSLVAEEPVLHAERWNELTSLSAKTRKGKIGP
jgi:hypothetical protein